MTPYTLSTPSPQPTTPPQNSTQNSAKEAAREARKADNHSDKYTSHDKTSKTSDKSTLTENKKEIADTDPSLFSELMSSLLNMPAPIQQTVTVKPVANDGTATAVNIVSDNTSAIGTSFSMDPALLVIPQTTSATTLTTTSDGSFSAELLAALTPGTPAPVTTGDATQTDALVAPVTVPVPVVTGDTTESLTVNADTQADPRLVACGFDPTQMSALKEKISKHAEPAVTNPATSSPQNKDGGVITVTFLPEKPVVQPQTITSSSNPAVVVATQTTVTVNPVTPETISQAAQNIDTNPADVKPQGETGEAVVSDENFDPVEFRIAQRFQRPVSQPSAAPEAPPQSVPADNATGNIANNNNSQHQNVTGKAKMTANAETSLSIPSSTILSATSSATDTLTANPSALPLTVTAIAASPVAHNISATQSHPAVQTVAAAIAKNAKEGGPQTINIRLDPPELGKLQVEMKYKKGDPLKVHVVLEKADTAAMFQRDAHALENALKDAGLQTDGSSLSFEFSQDGSAFKQAMKQDSSGHQSLSRTEVAISDAPAVESSLDIFTDNKTGLTHYNLRV